MFQHLLANIEMSHQVDSYSFRDGSTNQTWYVLAAGAVIVLIWLIIAYWEKIRGPFRGLSVPKSVFDELCQIHRLDRTESALLKKLAEIVKIDEPALAFVDPSYLARLAADPNHPNAVAYRALRKKLFGDNI